MALCFPACLSVFYPVSVFLSLCFPVCLSVFTLFPFFCLCASLSVFYPVSVFLSLRFPVCLLPCFRLSVSVLPCLSFTLFPSFCLCASLSVFYPVSVFLSLGIRATGDREGEKLFFYDVLLVKFMHLVLSRIPGESYVGDTGHCWCASCYSCDVGQAVLLPFVDHRRSGRRSVSEQPAASGQQ